LAERFLALAYSLQYLICEAITNESLLSPLRAVPSVWPVGNIQLGKRNGEKDEHARNTVATGGL